MEALICAGVIALGLMVVAIGQSTVPKSDRPYIWACFLGHVVSAFALLLLTYHFFGHGDVQHYYNYGDQLAEYIRREPMRWGPEVLLLILQQDADLPIHIFGTEGSSTTSIIGVTAFVMILTASSEYATGLLMSFWAFSGQWALYATFRNHFPEKYRKRVMIATLLMPSAVFWSSGVVKEAIALAGLGWIVWGLHRWIYNRRRLVAFAWIFFGGVTVAISKSYILFPMAAGAGIWAFWRRSMATRGSAAIATKPVYLAGAAVVAVVGMLALGEVFPRYSIDSLAEETANLQYQGERVEGGSSYSMGNPDETSLAGQLAFTPVALTAALFRPFIFEAHNPVALVNTLETTIILYLWIKILWIRGIRGAWQVIQSSPPLMFCLVFVLLFGLGVGLGTTNLGTLSRYRVPMMPLYGLILLMLYPRKES